MSRLSKLELVSQIFIPNHFGISTWITREQLEDTPLKLGGNGLTRQGVAYGVEKYIWEFKRLNDKSTGKITAMRTNGINQDSQANRPIKKAIRDHFKDNCCVVCATEKIVIDHKNDLYNDLRVLDSKTQTVDDFQALCNACNLRKRQVIKKTRETGKRFGATNIPALKLFGIDFITGDESYDPDDINAMTGTYWYDPVAFMEHIYNTIFKKN